MRGPRPRNPWVRALVSLVAVLVVYYAFPTKWTVARVLPGVLLTGTAVAVLGWAIAGQVRRHVFHGHRVELPTLTTMLGLVLTVFALGYYCLELASPGQMAGLSTRTDSLYFTMQVLTTVGLGDVHPAGQLARGMALVQMGFDLVFVAAAGSILAGSVRDRASRLRDPGGSPEIPDK